jgi:hypothetical protein
MTTEKKYIDVDEAFEVITDFAGQAETKSAYSAYWKAAKAIKGLTSVNMAAVRTGRWVQHCFEIECSACGAEALRDWNNCYVYSKHCPNCGANMN